MCAYAGECQSCAGRAITHTHRGRKSIRSNRTPIDRLRLEALLVFVIRSRPRPKPSPRRALPRREEAQFSQASERPQRRREEAAHTTNRHGAREWPGPCGQSTAIRPPTIGRFEMWTAGWIEQMIRATHMAIDRSTSSSGAARACVKGVECVRTHTTRKGAGGPPSS